MVVPGVWACLCPGGGVEVEVEGLLTPVPAGVSPPWVSTGVWLHQRSADTAVASWPPHRADVRCYNTLEPLETRDTRD